ncbi:MAG: hypothetical protein K5779_06345 [Saccharofermentans sp.]|nr:hypothetical protein [Saccharofermentans sp.]
MAKKRDESGNTGKGIQEESQLTLNIKVEELFDPYTVLPHPEVNPVVYKAVDRFVQRYPGEKMKITIMTSNVNPSLQEVFREAYYDHYDDELHKVKDFLHKRYSRVIILLVFSIAAFILGSFIPSHIASLAFIAGLITEFAIFCLWEIGYTHFDRSEASYKKKLILRARDAEIEFL